MYAMDSYSIYMHSVAVNDAQKGVSCTVVISVIKNLMLTREMIVQTVVKELLSISVKNVGAYMKLIGVHYARQNKRCVVQLC